MSQELGKVERPLAEDYQKGRKLFFVPLIFRPMELEAEFLEIVNRYWSQVEEQVSKLEAKLGRVNEVYHELVPVGGEEAAKVIEELNSESYQVVKACVEKGAELQPIEDGKLLVEFMDWGKCLAVGLQSQEIFTKVYEYYSEARKKRDIHIAEQIAETLKDDEVGILFMREGHQVQFSSDIQVFYVAPPGLDEIKRWLRSRESEVSGGDG